MRAQGGGSDSFSEAGLRNRSMGPDVPQKNQCGDKGSQELRGLCLADGESKCEEIRLSEGFCRRVWGISSLKFLHKVPAVGALILQLRRLQRQNISLGALNT